MTTRQENNLSMLLAVRKHLTDNISIWGGIVTFTTVVNLLIAKIILIQQAETKQSRSTKGLTGGKKTKKQVLIEKTVEGASALQSFASDSNDEDLYELVNFSESELEHLADSIVKDRAQLVLDTVNAHVIDVAGEGFDAGDILQLQTLINDYDVAMPATKNAISNKKTATSELKTLFGETDKLLETNLDKKMVQFKNSHPEFFSDYENNREIADLGVHHTRLGGTVTDADGNPIYNVTIIAEGAGLSESTDTDGKFLFKPFIPGVFNIRAEKAGFETQTIAQVEVGRGENKVLDFSLVAQGGGGGNDISGSVRDNTNMPVGGAQVELVGTAFTTVTQPTGMYLLSGVPAGNYTMRITAMGFPVKEIPVAMGSSGNLVVNVVL